MKHPQPIAITTILILSSANASCGAAGDVLLFDIDADRQAWENALAARGYFEFDRWDFGDLPDCGVYAFTGPLTCEGGGGIPPEFIPCEVSVDTVRQSTNNLRCVGPDAGFGNVSNAILAGYYTDWLRIAFDDVSIKAVDLSAMTLLGSDTVNLMVITSDGSDEFLRIPAPPHGRRYGLLATGDTEIIHVDIFDPGGGHEGIEGLGVIYTELPFSLAVLTDFTIITGTHLGGGIDDLIESDDLSLRARSGLGGRISEAHLMEMVIRADTDEVDSDHLTVRVEARLDEPNGAARLRLRNWTTGAFDTVGQGPIGLTDTTIQVAEIDATDYVRPSGAIDLSIKHIVFVPFLAFRFESFIDLVEIEVW